MDPRREHRYKKFSRVSLWVFRVLCVLAALYFFWALLLQFNDTDWILSVAVYAGAVLVTLVAATDRIPYPVSIIAGLIVLIVDTWWLYKFLTTARCQPITSLWDMCHAGQNLFGYVIIAVWLFAVAVRGVIREYNVISRHFVPLQDQEQL